MVPVLLPVQSVQWTRAGEPLPIPNVKVAPPPQPLAEVWNPASGEIRKPSELTHCPKCNQPGFKVDPDAPRLAGD